MTAALAPAPGVDDPLEALLLPFSDTPRPLLDQRRLLRRTDTKLVCPIGSLAGLLPLVARDYAVLRVPSGAAIADYRNLYFDTPQLQLFHDHRRGRRIRHKVRIRHYPDRHVSFLEVKTRRSELVVDKRRLAIAFGGERLGEGELAWVAGRVGELADHLHPQVRVDYRRVTLVGLASHERVTIDVDIELAGLTGVPRVLGPIAVVEVKQARLSHDTPIMRALAAAGLRPASSKYALAITRLRPDVRCNRLMPDLRAFARSLS